MACFADSDNSSDLFQQIVLESFGRDYSEIVCEGCGEDICSVAPSALRSSGGDSTDESPHSEPHRDKLTPAGNTDVLNQILEHEPIPPREVKYNPEAQKALQVEWDKLRDQGAWDLQS